MKVFIGFLLAVMIVSGVRPSLLVDRPRRLIVLCVIVGASFLSMRVVQ
ncbi:hypothetical protein [Ilumatobacter coccineus]|nr:hypothetical protein [Ilumatobacter coccineus]